MDSDVVIRFEHVFKSYGTIEVLKDFSLDIKKGQFVTVIGSSGSGKTTMLKMINGLLSPDIRYRIYRWKRYIKRKSDFAP